MSFPSFKQNNGFTLIEMLISVAILSIITGIGVINLTNYKNRHSFELDTKNVLEATRNAENKSILGDQGTGWGIKFTSNVDNGYFEIFSGTSYATSSVVVTQYLSSASRFSNPPPGFSKTIVFGQITGVPDASQMIALKTVTGSDSSITSLGARGTLNQLPGKDLVGYWPMDEGLGTTAYDASGGGNNGTLQNSPMWQITSACKTGQCLSFNGSTNSVVVPGSGSSLQTSSQISVFVWVNPTSTNPGRIIQKDGTSYTRLWELGYYGGIRMELWHSNGAAICWGGGCGGPQQALAPGQWAFVGFTFDGTTITMYYNGASIGSTSFPGDIRTDGATPVTIGANWGASEIYSGLIDDARIYDRALTATEVKTLYESY